MDIITKENLGILLGVIGAVGAIPVFKGYYIGALTSNNTRKLRKLRDERAFFVRLQASTMETAVYLVQGVLIVLAIIGASMMFSAIPGNDGATFVPLSNATSGFAIYMVAIWRLGKLNRLAKFERTLDMLDREIERLERKLSAGQASAR
ncbi:hypothetical protein ACVBGC_26850 [Burkholderia stagnalis]